MQRSVQLYRRRRLGILSKNNKQFVWYFTLPHYKFTAEGIGRLHSNEQWRAATYSAVVGLIHLRVVNALMS